MTLSSPITAMYLSWSSSCGESVVLGKLGKMGEYGEKIIKRE
jgi:hypothetical protein